MRHAVLQLSLAYHDLSSPRGRPADAARRSPKSEKPTHTELQRSASLTSNCRYTPPPPLPPPTPPPPPPPPLPPCAARPERRWLCRVFRLFRSWTCVWLYCERQMAYERRPDPVKSPMPQSMACRVPAPPRNLCAATRPPQVAPHAMELKKHGGSPSDWPTDSITKSQSHRFKVKPISTQTRGSF